MPEELNTKDSTDTLLWILLGVIIGVSVGGFWPFVGREISFLGDIFIHILLALVIPLILCSLVVSVVNLSSLDRVNALGKYAIGMYILTTFFSVLIGITLVNVIKPGKIQSADFDPVAFRGGLLDPQIEYVVRGTVVTVKKNTAINQRWKDKFELYLLDRKVRGGIVSVKRSGDLLVIKVDRWEPYDPTFSAKEVRGKGIKIDAKDLADLNLEKRSLWQTIKDMVAGLFPKNIIEAMLNNRVLQIIVFALAFGYVLLYLGERAQYTRRLFLELDSVFLNLVELIMKAAPVGVGALIAGRIGMAGGFKEFIPELVGLLSYALTVIAGLFVHAFLVLPIFLMFVGKRNPIRYLKGVLPAIVTAFATASSSATLPVTLDNTTQNNDVSEATASFVLPLGATINMDGTALYEAVAAIFIAQIYGIDLNAVQMFVIFLTSTLAAIGAAGIPEAGLVTMVLVLTSVGLPVEGIGLILSIDWALDRFRTSVNVWGDCVVAAIVDKFTGNN